MFGSRRAFSFIRLGALFEWNGSVVHPFGCRQISQLGNGRGKRAFLVDTLALVIAAIWELVAVKEIFMLFLC